jgi:beta-xylosidase
LLALAILILLAIACDDDPVPPPEPVGPRFVCASDAVSPLLASKLDDDDGDGNPLDERYPALNDEDDDIADHCWIKDHSGTFHLFFHTESRQNPSHIDHYTTHNFQSLSYVGTALDVAPGAWDADGVWAPHVIEHDGTYYMFYTGVHGSGAEAVQRTGIATSTDLYTWVRYAINRCPGTAGNGCVYECNEPWTTFSINGEYDRQCRDPFVIWDEGTQRWLLFNTSKSLNTAGVVTVAAAANLTDWVGAGYIDATRRLSTGTAAQQSGGQCENAFVVKAGGRYYLIFADWQDVEDDANWPNPRTMAQYATSTTLEVDGSGSLNWVYRGYLPDPGVNAIEIIDPRETGIPRIMSQSVASERSGVPPDSRRTLRLKCVTFSEDEKIVTEPFGLAPEAQMQILGPR